MVAFNSPGPGQDDRRHLLRFNAEHSERYWLQAFEASGESHLVLLLDIRDRVAFDIAQRLAGPERTAAMIQHALDNDNIPTLHAAVPMAASFPLMSFVCPSFVPHCQRVPDDSFAVWCISSGGSSLAFRKRPAVGADCEGAA